MFENNTVINELYNKLSENENLIAKSHNKREKVYGRFAFSSLIATIIIALSQYSSNPIVMSVFMIIFFVTCFAFLLALMDNDPFPWLWYKSAALLKQQDTELKDYIKQESVQIEIIDFAKNHPNIDLYKLKKSFAFKEYEYGLYLLFVFLNELARTYDCQEAKNKEEKFINDYELNLRMKL